MSAVVEDIAGRSVDWNGSRIGGRIWVLSVDRNQSCASVCDEAVVIIPSVQLQRFEFLRWSFRSHVGDLIYCKDFYIYQGGGLMTMQRKSSNRTVLIEVD